MAEGEGFAHKVTKENLETFAPILGTPADEDEDWESGAAEATAEGGGTTEDDHDTDLGLPDEFFEGERFPVALGRAPAPHRRGGTSERAGEAAEEGPTHGERGPERWVHPSITESEAQRPSNPNTSITGQLRLAQRGYEVDGESIDWTTYFRYEVFGDLEWEPEEGNKEVAETDFEIEIFGTSYGRRTLEIVHEPEWVSDQANIPTHIRWKSLLPVLRNEVDIEGARLTLYDPPEGQEEPYFLVIERT